MIKRLFVIIAILFAGFALNAQEQMRDVVYLKNGGITKGIIIELNPNESLKVQMADGSVFVYKMDEVERVEKETIEPIENPMFKQSPYTPSQPVPMQRLAPRKSPLAAGILSALIPGAGQLYASGFQSGWRYLAWDFIGYPVLGFTTLLLPVETWLVSWTLLGIAHTVVWVTSIIDAVNEANDVNFLNGYVSFPLGDKARLGVRPEFSYNNQMMPNGGFAPQFTSGVGFSLSF